MHTLEQEINEIREAHRMGNLTLDQRNYLLEEIRDIKAAQECADNEEMFRYIVQVCNVAMSVA